jgi:hypothetical protein
MPANKAKLDNEKPQASQIQPGQQCESIELYIENNAAPNFIGSRGTAFQKSLTTSINN